MKVNRKNIYIIVMTLMCLLLEALHIREKEQEVQETMGNVQENSNADLGTKKIALTFDDGPHPYYTEQLLDGLKERGVKATFFVTGEHAELHIYTPKTALPFMQILHLSAFITPKTKQQF